MPSVVTDRADFRAVAAAAPDRARVPLEVHATVEDPFEAYRRARADVGGAYLETTGGQSGWGYFATDPVEFVSVDPGEEATIDRLMGTLESETLARGDCDVPFPCGAIGWLSYDVARELEDLPGDAERDRALPRLQLAVYDRMAAWQAAGDGETTVTPGHGETTIRVTACPRVGDFGSVDGAYAYAREHAASLVRAMTEGDRATGPPEAPGAAATFESDVGAAAYEDGVRRVKEYIRAGDTFQVNLSHRLRAPAAVHPVEAFSALRRVNPAPYSALLEFPGVDLVSASPELLLERRGDRLLTEPIAGTRPRGATAAADEALERELRTDEKERAEHAMLVDLERNDLGTVSAYGSVDVTEYRRVDRYAEVMHLVSAVEGRLRPTADLGDAIAAVFPGGTITGAPKPRTMAIIDELERTRRGPYTGSIGIFGFDGRATLNIAIRTLVRHAAEYHLRVGAGVVHDSVPEREYAETLDKARGLVTAVDEALGERVDLSVTSTEGTE